MTSVPFDIPITDDIIFEGNENFTLTIDPSLPTGVSVGTPDEATVTIVDDDRKKFYDNIVDNHSVLLHNSFIKTVLMLLYLCAWQLIACNKKLDSYN